MTDHHARSATETRTDPPRDRGDGGHLLSVGSLTVVAMSVLCSLVGYGLLPARIRIHWSLGLGPYHGPEFASTLVVLSVFPALVLGGALLGRLVVARLRQVEGSRFRPYDAVAVVGTLVTVFGVQAALILLNL